MRMKSPIRNLCKFPWLFLTRCLPHPCSWPSEDAGCYTDLFRNLAAVIRDGAEPAVKWSEAAAVIEMIELAYKSSREGVTVPVPVPAAK